MKVPLFAFILQIVLLAGATLLLVFVLLSGGVSHFPFNKFYWIEADTSAISGAPDISRWTFWGLNEKTDNKNKAVDLNPAYAFSPVDNFQTTSGVPQDFIDNRDVYFYLSRFAFAFFWIAMAFTGVSLILSIFTLCSYSIVKINGWLLSIALLFDAGAVAMETAISVMGKSAFSNDGHYAHIGPALLGVAWASVACLIILFFLSWGEYIGASYKKHKNRVAAAKAAESQSAPANDRYPTQQPAQTEFEDPYAQPQQQQQGTLANDSGIKFFRIGRRNKEDQESV
ncbi:CYFA0S01e16028g1_1 [Cyberlindnera fabianii]|uniref:CYFA0S01e16028g1_1 n=1 Tax=Cyberlindnera fabianii TaxID=36022 RepID=A0A061AQS6_CYBFA|nr:Protein SUR7 [Cyberlindnera fabianii]CDR37733.1 CYFA0S01e16028g1_1 [Cyberlindnera fabianii]